MDAHRNAADDRSGRAQPARAWPLVVLVVLVAPCALSAGGPAVTGYELSFDQAVATAGGLVADEELAIDDLAGGLERLDLALPAGVDLAAFHRLSATSFLFAVDSPVLLPDGFFAEQSDVVSYSPEDGYGLVFDTGTLAGAGGIDGLSYDAESLTLYLSFDVDLVFGSGTSLHAHDVMSIELALPAFDLLFDGCNEGVPPGVDVDAIHWDPIGQRLFLSFDSAVALGAPLPAEDEDVVLWLPGVGWAVVRDLSAAGAAFASLDTDALHVRLATDDLLFFDGFESGTTGAWSSAVP